MKVNVASNHVRTCHGCAAVLRKSTEPSALGFTAAGCRRPTPASTHDFQLAKLHLLASSPILQFTQLRDPLTMLVTSDMQAQRRS